MSVSAPPSLTDEANGRRRWFRRKPPAPSDPNVDLGPDRRRTFRYRRNVGMFVVLIVVPFIGVVLTVGGTRLMARADTVLDDAEQALHDATQAREPDLRHGAVAHAVRCVTDWYTYDPKGDTAARDRDVTACAPGVEAQLSGPGWSLVTTAHQAAVDTADPAITRVQVDAHLQTADGSRWARFLAAVASTEDGGYQLVSAPVEWPLPDTAPAPVTDAREYTTDSPVAHQIGRMLGGEDGTSGFFAAYADGDDGQLDYYRAPDAARFDGLDGTVTLDAVETVAVENVDSVDQQDRRAVIATVTWLRSDIRYPQKYELAVVEVDARWYVDTVGVHVPQPDPQEG